MSVVALTTADTGLREQDFKSGMSCRVRPGLKHRHPQKREKRKKWTPVFVDTWQSLKG